MSLTFLSGGEDMKLQLMSVLERTGQHGVDFSSLLCLWICKSHSKHLSQGMCPGCTRARGWFILHDVGAGSNCLTNGGSEEWFSRGTKVVNVN